MGKSREYITKLYYFLDLTPLLNDEQGPPVYKMEALPTGQLKILRYKNIKKIKRMNK
jgi:hypothetical protein